MATSLDAQLREMRAGLDLRPEEIDTSNLFPILVPASFFDHGNWPGPFARLKTSDIGLTWTVLLPSQTMRYVNFEMAQHWEACGIDWKDLALRNLARETETKEGARELRRTTGEVSAIAFMFEDGLGPSRLLFRNGLSQLFSAGYRVALPEMSCGIAFAIDLEGEDLATVQGVIDNCFQNGTRPLVSGSYDPDDLLPVE
ncbi:MAG TPA: hypothetical protein VGF59_06115 [Bryobacteraceae bacterium]|jgi:hypothetical protein